MAYEQDGDDQRNLFLARAATILDRNSAAGMIECTEPTWRARSTLCTASNSAATSPSELPSKHQLSHFVKICMEV